MKPDLSESFSKLIQAATLVEINLKSGNVECLVPPALVIPNETRLDQVKYAKYALSEDKKLLVCFVSLSSDGISAKGETAETLFKMSGTFMLIYSLSITDVPDEAYQLFTDNNALYNAYPYFRELFHTFSTRIGIQPVKLPLLKPLTKADVDKAMQKGKGQEKN